MIHTGRKFMTMLWKDKYELGVPLIDGQHKELFRRVALFMQALRSDESWEKKLPQLDETLAFMKKYVVAHFAAEEAYQRDIGYPHYQAHKQLHDDMVRYVQEVSEKCGGTGCDEQLMQQFGGRLLAWLVNHVAAEDQRIADYAKRREGNGHD